MISNTVQNAVNDQINKELYSAPQGLLQWLVDEQAEEEKDAEDVVNQTKMAGEHSRRHPIHRASFLSRVGKRTEVLARFSTMGDEKGSPTRSATPGASPSRAGPRRGRATHGHLRNGGAPPGPRGDVDFVRAGNPCRQVMTAEERDHLMGNLVPHLRSAQKRPQLRQAALFYEADAEYGERVVNGLELSMDEVQRLAGTSQDECAKATAG